MTIIYATQPARIGRNEWIIAIVMNESHEVKCIPLWKPLSEREWRYPAEFPTAVPAKVLQLTFDNIIPLAETMKRFS